MTKKDNGAQIALRGVKEREFSINSSVVKDDDDDMSFSFGFQLKPDETADMVEVFLRVKVSTLSGEQALLIGVSYFFDVKELTSFIRDNGQGGKEITGIAEHLMNVAVGTTRGLIVAKTVGTPLERFPMPMIDIHTMLSNAKKS